MAYLLWVVFMDKSLSIIIPAYNEENRVLPTIESYHSFFSRKFKDFELIVVCNNCSDSTPKKAEQVSRRLKNLRCLNFPFYTGKGGAVYRGFDAASGEMLGFTDADNSIPPEEFEKIVKALSEGNADAAIGSRALRNSVIEKRQPPHRVFSAKAFSLLVNLMFSLGIPDTQCGAKAFKKTAVKKIKNSLKSTGWEFDVELLWKLKKNGFKIRQVPVKWTDSEETKFSFSAVPGMFFSLLKIRLGL